MKRYKTKDIIEMLEKDGCYYVSQKGSHRMYKHPKKKGRVVVNGKYNETQTQFIINSIFKQAGWKE